MIEAVKVIEKFSAKVDFLAENPICKYMIIDFFAGTRLNIMGNKIFALERLQPFAVYDFVRKHIFSVNPEENADLTAYLFTQGSLLKLYNGILENEISELKQKISELEEKESES